MTSKTAARSAITAAFSAIPTLQSGFRDGRDVLLDECYVAERQHRRNRPVVPGFSVMDAARYFTIKYLYQTLTGALAVEVADYLSIRHEIFTAAALSVRFADKLRSEGAEPYKQQIEAVLALDYAELME